MGSHVTVLGWYGHGNCGDEAYKTAFPSVFPAYDMTFTDELKAAHKQSAGYIMGGGDIVYSHLLQKMKAVSGPRHLMSVSLSSSDCVEQVGEIFDVIAVRDKPSLERLKRFGIEGQYVPDVVFALKGDRARGQKKLQAMFEAERRELYSKVVIVVMNAHLAVKEGQLSREASTFEKVACDLAYLADSTPASFVFVPFGYDAPHDDRITNSWVSGKCKYWKKNLVVYNRLTPMDTLDLFHAADAAVVTRLHAGIFSTIGGTPFIDLTHHDKTKDFLSTHGLSDWSLVYWSVDKLRCGDLLDGMLADPKAADRVRAVDKACKDRLAEFSKTRLVAS
jgi:polysaccharide pyruvyl transferase WcaK-like protein